MGRRAEQTNSEMKWVSPSKGSDLFFPLQEETIMGTIKPSQLIEEPFSINNSSDLLIYDDSDLYAELTIVLSKLVQEKQRRTQSSLPKVFVLTVLHNSHFDKSIHTLLEC